MEDQKFLPTNDASVNKPRKKKTSIKEAIMFQAPGDSARGQKGRNASRRGTTNGSSPMFGPEMGDPNIAPGDGIKKQKGLKASKRDLVNGVSPLLGQEKLMSDSLSESDYRTLRRKYLLLEEESHGVEMELQEVEADNKALEEQKLCLLDELVVLEGLIDPSDLQTHGQRLP